MKKKSVTIQRNASTSRLNPSKPAERKVIIERAVQKAFKDYGKTLKKLGAE